MVGNQAIGVNSVVGPQADLQINRRGSDWYYTVCAIMTVSTFIFAGTSFMKPRSHRLFHYITAGITLVAAIAYWCMGSNLGQVPIQAEFVRPYNSQVFAAGTREIFYVRYIDWVITTPLLLLDLLLTAGVSWPTILITLLLDEVMIVTGLVGALTQTSYKWGFYAFAMVALLFVAYQLLGPGLSHAKFFGGSIKRTYTLCGVWLIFLWFLYPISWGLSEGGNVIHPDAEAIFYGILDIAAKVGFGGLLLWGHRTIDPETIGMHIREPGESTGHHGMSKGEKGGYNNGVHNGATNNTGGVTSGAGGYNAGTGATGAGTGTGMGAVHHAAGTHDSTVAGNEYGTGYGHGAGNVPVGTGPADASTRV